MSTSPDGKVWLIDSRQPRIRKPSNLAVDNLKKVVIVNNTGFSLHCWKFPSAARGSRSTNVCPTLLALKEDRRRTCQQRGPLESGIMADKSPQRQQIYWWLFTINVYIDILLCGFIYVYLLQILYFIVTWWCVNPNMIVWLIWINCSHLFKRCSIYRMAYCKQLN